jgi:hypothetical protein
MVRSRSRLGRIFLFSHQECESPVAYHGSRPVLNAVAGVGPGWDSWPACCEKIDGVSVPPDGIPYRHHNREWHSNRECNGAMAKVFNDDFGTQFE